MLLTMSASALPSCGASATNNGTRGCTERTGSALAILLRTLSRRAASLLVALVPTVVRGGSASQAVAAGPRVLGLPLVPQAGGSAPAT
jgi:hypothetical protein